MQSKSRATMRALVWVFVGALTSAGIGFGLLSGSGSGSGSGEPESKTESKRAPGFELEGVRDPDVKVSLSDFEGKPVVLNFFADWCVPCRKELPRFAAAHRARGDSVAFVGIDHEDSRSRATDLLEETGVTYPTGYDPGGSVADAYGLTKGMPVTVFIDGNGRIVGQVLGEVSTEELNEWLDRLEAGEGGKDE